MDGSYPYLYALDFRGSGIRMGLNRGGRVTIEDRAMLQAWDVMSSDGSPSDLAVLTAKEQNLRGHRVFGSILWPAYVLIAHALPMFPLASIDVQPMDADSAFTNTPPLFDAECRITNGDEGPHGRRARLLNIVQTSDGAITAFVHIAWWNRLYFTRKALINTIGRPDGGEDCLLRLTDEDGGDILAMAAIPYKRDKDGSWGVSTLSGMLVDTRTPYRGLYGLLGVS